MTLSERPCGTFGRAAATAAALSSIVIPLLPYRRAFPLRDDPSLPFLYFESLLRITVIHTYMLHLLYCLFNERVRWGV